MDFHWQDYKYHAWGKVYLRELNNGFNQKWSLLGNEFACKGFKDHQYSNLRLNVYGNDTKKGARVGIYKSYGGPNQKWTLKGKCSKCLHGIYV